MTPPAATDRYKHYRFPADIISHGVWLYYRFCLSYRDVEELLFARGIIVTYETIRQWCRKFGQSYANQLRRLCPQLGDKWHLDEVFVSINGERHYLWRAVDQDGHILAILVQRRRDQHAVKKFFRKLLKGCQYVPRAIITDSSKAMVRPSGKSCLAWNIGSTAILIIAPRTPISRRASGSGACRALNHRVMPSASLLPMGPSPNISVHDGIGCQRPRTVKRCATDSSVGPRSQVRSALPKRQGGPG
jgi:transposase-like protein